MSGPLLTIAPTGDPHRFRLAVDDGVCVGPPGNVFLFGGCGLGAAMLAMRAVSGREPICASVQFLSYARVGAMLDLTVAMPVAGRNVSQATVVARVGEETIFTATGASGDRVDQPDHQWIDMPPMPLPDECVPWAVWPRQGAVSGAGLISQLDLRMEAGSPGTVPREGTVDREGRMRMWIRTIDDAPVDAAMLALFADFVPSGAAAALGWIGGGNSLDNVLRVRRIVPTRWVLCDIHMNAVDRGFGHGDVRMFAEDGTLMATGGQSMILRRMSA